MRYHLSLFWAAAVISALGFLLAQCACWATGLCTPHPTTMTEPR